MTAENFKSAWTKDGSSLVPIHIDRLKNLNLQESTINFLTNSGLPTDASPFLNFIADTIDYKGIGKVTNLYDFLDNQFEKYIVIGSDGSGNPVVINTETNDQIELLDHEDNFSPKFMNSSIATLAEFLLLYRNFIEQIITENGEDAFLNSNFSLTQYENLIKELNAADIDAVTKAGFWKEEIEMLLADRNEN